MILKPGNLYKLKRDFFFDIVDYEYYLQQSPEIRVDLFKKGVRLIENDIVLFLMESQYCTTRENQIEKVITYKFLYKNRFLYFYCGDDVTHKTIQKNFKLI